jgi:hypothetical protein
VDGGPETRGQVRDAKGAAEVCLVEEGDDAVAGLEAGAFWAEGDNCS